jgi:hypothetical protein
MRGWVVAVVAMSVVSGCASEAKAPVGGGTVGSGAQASMQADGVDPATQASVAAGGGAKPPGAPASTEPTAGTNAAGATTNQSGRPVNRALIAQGYQPSTYRGQLFYCRKQKLTGSQFTQRVCITEQEAALQERIAQDEMNKRNSQGKCVKPLCPDQ